MRIRRPWTFRNKKKITNDDLKGFDPRAIKEAHIRLAVLQDYHSKISNIRGRKERAQAIREFLQICNSGLIFPEGVKKSRGICRSTLYNWDKKYRERGFSALIPCPPWKPKATAALIPINLHKKIIEIKIPGPPIARGIKEFRTHIRRQWSGSPLECPIRLHIFYSIPIPKGTKMTRRMPMLRHQISPKRTPYLDSLQGFTIAGMEGIVFKDHSQIMEFHSEKSYYWVPKTRILVKTLAG